MKPFLVLIIALRVLPGCAVSDDDGLDAPDSGADVTNPDASDGAFDDNGADVTSNPDAIGDSGTEDSSPLPAPTVSDPVTAAIMGSHHTYHVGPGREYEEPETVPWGALEAGDVVNIHYRVEPYAWKLCLRGRGTASDPIVINGVTDTSGNRPRFDFDGARTASGCNPGGGNDVFDTGSVWSLEDYAGIMIRDGVSDEWGYKPGWIVIQNLELYGAGVGSSFTDLEGETRDYIESAAAIWIQPSTDILLQNNVIYDNGFGVFTMAKDSSLQAACERITLRSNRIYGNGVVDSYLEHNVYMQSTNPIIEGNYFGVVRDGSAGASYKSRSSGEVFRYNYVEASARAIDWVYAEEQTPGIATQADYGVDYAYGNIIINDCALGSCAGYPLHYGGDNLGEQEASEELFQPSVPYRSHLYFYNNTVLVRMDAEQMWRLSVFDLSERGTRVDAWNNIFYAAGSAHFAWLQYAGDLRLHGNNLVYGSLAEFSDQALELNCSVTVLGTLLTGDPAFWSAESYDVRLGVGSPALGAATDAPTEVSASAMYADLPVSLQPVIGSNGLRSRTAHDLGAVESE